MKYKILFIALLVSTSNAFFSQTFTLSNQMDVTTYGNDNLQTSIPTDDGGLLVFPLYTTAGIVGDKTVPNYGQSDAWFVKVDPTLSGIDWQVDYGGALSDDPGTSLQTSNGNFLLGIQSFSTIGGNKTVTNYGERDFWIVCIDDQGNEKWQVDFGGSKDDVVYALAEDDAGYFYAGGYTKSSISGTKTTDSIGGGDCWLIKMDSLGNVVWDKTYGTTSYESILKLSISNNELYLLCTAEGGVVGGDKTDPGFLYSDIWMLKLDTAGNKIWDKSYGGSGNDGLLDGQAIVSGPDNLYVACSSNSGTSSMKSEGLIGGYSDIWAFKIDTSGAVLWENTIGTTQVDFVTSISTNHFGEIILSTYTAGDDVDKTSPLIGTTDNWLVALDSLSGAINWQYAFGGTQADYAYGIYESSPNNYIGVSASQSGVGGDKTVPNYSTNIGDTDWWLYTINTTTSIIEYADEIKVFPNPTKDYVYFSELVSNYSIQDLRGRVVSKSGNNFTNEIFVGELPTGVYIVNYTFTGKVYHQKFVKE